MALSGTISTSLRGRVYKIVWSASQSVTNNTSTITCKHYLVNDATFSLYINGRTNSCTVGGVEKSFSSSSISTSGGSSIHLGTTTHTVSHNADGTKSVTIKGVFNIQATLSGTYYSSLTASGTVTLDTIPRASTPTVSGTKSLGSTMTITTNRASSSFTHTLKWEWADKSGTIATGVGSSTTWTPSVATFAPYLTNAASGTCVITCTTYNGSTTIGTKTVSFELSIPSSVVPSVSSVTASDEKGYASKYGAYIQNRSSVKVVTSAEGVYSSTIKTYAVTMDNLSGSSSSCTIGTPSNTGTRTVTSKVTDTRGRTASKTASINVVAYSAPSLLNLSAFRAVNGVADDTSTTVRVIYGAVVDDINGAGANSKKLKIAWVSESNSSSTTITLSSYSVSGGTYDITGIPTDETCAITLTLTDDITSASRSANVGTAEPLLNFSPNGRALGIGTIVDEDADGFLAVGWEAEFDKSVTMRDGLNLLGSMYISNNQAYRSFNTNGDFRNLAYINETNAYRYGQGSYQNNEGAAYYEGNTVSIRSNDWVYITSPSAGISYRAYGQNKVLATTASYMNETQTVTLSEAVSAQPNGVVLVWSWYASGAKDYEWTYFFVPKHHPNISSGGGIEMFSIDSSGGTHMAKYVYVTDTQVKGNSRNSSGGKTLGGLSVNNGYWVLRYVIGV